MNLLVLAFRELFERSGGRFVLVNTGHRGERTPLFQALRRRLHPEGVHFLGLEGVLGEARTREPERPWDFGRDPHWNVAAHALVARVVREFLAAEGLLERGPARAQDREPSVVAAAPRPAKGTARAAVATHSPV